MVQANPPLFVQDGEYPAKMDRNLIGALIQPSANSNTPLVPRAGVRPHFVDASGETSLRVEISGGQARVLPGSAFVGGPSIDGIGAVYLITNPVDSFVPLPPVIDGAVQQVQVGIRVTDPGDVPAGGAVEGKWEFEYLSVIPPTPPPTSLWLRLATIDIPSSSSTPIPPPIDTRVYTTALGGTLYAASLDTLNSGYANAPFGTHAYAYAEDQMYVRGRRGTNNTGWSPIPAVAQLSTSASNGGIPGHTGELLWNTVNQTLSVHQSGQWLDVASVPAVVRTGESTAYPDKKPNEQFISIPNLQLYVTGGTGWLSIGSGAVAMRDPAVAKPPENAMLMKVYSPALRNLVTATLYATVQAFTQNVNGGFDPDPTNQFWMNFDIFTSSGTTFDEDGRPSGYQQMYSVVDGEGLTWTDRAESKNFHKPMNRLAQGTTSIRIVFKAARDGYFDITNLGFRVNTAYLKDLAT